MPTACLPLANSRFWCHTNSRHFEGQWQNASRKFCHTLSFGNTWRWGRRSTLRLEILAKINNLLQVRHNLCRVNVILEILCPQLRSPFPNGTFEADTQGGPGGCESQRRESSPSLASHPASWRAAICHLLTRAQKNC